MLLKRIRVALRICRVQDEGVINFAIMLTFCFHQTTRRKSGPSSLVLIVVGSMTFVVLPVKHHQVLGLVRSYVLLTPWDKH